MKRQKEQGYFTGPSIDEREDFLCGPSKKDELRVKRLPSSFFFNRANFGLGRREKRLGVCVPFCIRASLAILNGELGRFLLETWTFSSSPSDISIFSRVSSGVS